MAAVLVVGSSSSMAASLQVTPLRLELTDGSPSGLMTVRNADKADVLLQMSVQNWSIQENQDKLDPTRDVLLNPGIAVVKAGDQQIVRLALRVPQTQIERDYRVVIQEVPQQHAVGVATVLRIVLPLFVPPTQSSPVLQWDIRPAHIGWELAARNLGNVHYQIRSIKLMSASTALLDTKSFFYVLPGSVQTVPLTGIKSLAAGAVIHLTADSDQGRISTDVRVGAAEVVPGRD
jgi:fimbrial chaperone protein